MKAGVLGNLLKNSSMMFVLNLATVGVGVLTIPITLKAIGVEAFGHLVLIQAIASTIFTICGFQYWQGMLVALPGHRVEPDLLRQNIWRSLRYETIGVSAVLLGCLVLAIIELPQTGKFSFGDMVLLALSVVLPVMGTQTAYYRLINRYSMLMLAGLLTNVAKLGLLHWAAHGEPSIHATALAYGLPEVLRAMVLFGYIVCAKRGIDGTLDGSQIPIQRLKDAGRWSTLQAIADLPVAHIDRIIIGFTLPGAALGVFAILKRIFSLVNLATAPFYSTSIPEFAAYANKGDYAASFRLWRRTMILLFGATLGSAVICYLAMPIWMPLIFPGLADYPAELAVVLLTAVAAGTFITTHSFHWGLGKLRQAALITVVTNIIYLVLLAALTFAFGLIGTVSAFLVHVLLAASIKIIILKRFEGAHV